MPKQNNRLPASLFTVRHGTVNANTGESSLREIDVSVAWSANGQATEIVFVGRGKIGQGIDLLLTDLGIALSRVLQNRDPNTGQELGDE